jgi:hypothetical protein
VVHSIVWILAISAATISRAISNSSSFEMARQGIGWSG